MNFTHRRPQHHPSKLPFFMIVSGIVFLAWIGMAEKELGISTVHWIGHQSVPTAANHAADQAPQQPPAPAGAASDKAAPVAQPKLVPPQPPLSLFNDAAGRPDPNGVCGSIPCSSSTAFLKNTAAASLAKMPTTRRLQQPLLPRRAG